jgi:hypothetical protein
MLYTPNGGFFNAANFPLATYISFAYKVMGNQAQVLPSLLPQWALDERFDEAGESTLTRNDDVIKPPVAAGVIQWTARSADTVGAG